MKITNPLFCLSLFALITAGCTPPQPTTETKTEEGTGDEIIVLPDDTPSIDHGLSASPDTVASIDTTIAQYETDEGREQTETLPPPRGGASIDEAPLARGDAVDNTPEDVALVQQYQGTPEIAPLPQPSDDPVTAYIETAHVERPDMAGAVRLAPRAFDTARQILESQDAVANHGRAALLIGLSGHAEAEPVLTQYVLAGAARKLSGLSYDARRDAIFALGYLANVTQGEQGLAFLLETARPEGWVAQNAQWQGPYFDTQAERDIALAQLSLLALVLSGQDAAAVEIQRLVDRQTAANAVFTPAEARELLIELRKVRAMGLVAYSAQRP